MTASREDSKRVIRRTYALFTFSGQLKLKKQGRGFEANRRLVFSKGIPFHCAARQRASPAPLDIQHALRANWMKSWRCDRRGSQDEWAMLGECGPGAKGRHNTQNTAEYVRQWTLVQRTKRAFKKRELGVKWSGGQPFGQKGRNDVGFLYPRDKPHDEFSCIF